MQQLRFLLNNLTFVGLCFVFFLVTQIDDQALLNMVTELTSSRPGTGGQKCHEWPQNRFVVQKRLPGLRQQHLVHPELL